MSKFDEQYDIIKAKKSDIPNLQEYIKTNWNSDHILARDEKFFEYEYCSTGGVNFLLAINCSDGKIAGMIGYIQASSDPDHLDIWPTMWKVSDNALPLLGIELYKRLYDITGARNILGCGNNRDTSSVMLDIVMKYKNMKMKHYYRLATRDNYQIAVVSHKPDSSDQISDCSQNKALDISKITDEIELIETLKDLTDINAVPYKDGWYYVHRFMTYPYYSYTIWRIADDRKKALLITREQKHNDSAALRIVDFVGEDSMFSSLGSFFTQQLDNYEYIDFYECGMADDCILGAGFTEIREDDDNIIPNYFSPYVAKNIDIWCSSRNGIGRFFKADGDQDRPSLIV